MTVATQNGIEYALALETSSDWGGVALGRGPEVLTVQTFDRPRVAASGFVPAIAAVCKEGGVLPGDVREVYVSCGPGSFTGLRLAVSAARILSWAFEARVVAVPTLEVIAHNALDLTPPPMDVAVMIDAKRLHVYASRFHLHGDEYLSLDAAAEVEPVRYLGHLPPGCALIGDRSEITLQASAAAGMRFLPYSLGVPRAEWVYQLGYRRARRGGFTNRRDLVPAYVRPPEAAERWAARHGMGTSA